MDYRIKERILKNMLIEITKKYDYILGDYKALESQYNERLLKDYLTGLFNRDGFIAQLKNLHRKCEQEKVSYGVLVLDLDNFKYINGFYGQDIGDIFLKEISNIIVKSTPDTSIQARIGVDEFAVAVYGIDEEDLIKISNNIKKAIEDFRFIVGDSFITSTASIGISFNKQCKNFNQVFEESLNALAESKQRGKNSITFYDASLQRKSENLINGRNLILKALSRENGVIPFIQPIIQVNSRDIVGGEFLIRLNVDGDIYTPAYFLESALYFGLIDKLEKEMLSYIEDINFRSNLIFFVNKSINKDEKFTDLKEDVAILSSISGKKSVDFVIEITENSLFENVDDAKALIDFGRESKVKFAIDDFGSGYTSLRYLHQFDIDFLKIDGHLIKQMNSNQKMEAIVKGIVNISKLLNIKTVAEYVETHEDYKRCVDLGIDYCQGYYFYKPMEVEEFLKLL
ncbi:MAG: GGDEF and EAL domain-containing protein [Hydrogenothermaceae bacterium]|nr:GGDEF and EAL domain-containing protein [Hydrogenothermaceae bacterium]